METPPERTRQVISQTQPAPVLALVVDKSETEKERKSENGVRYGYDNLRNANCQSNLIRDQAQQSSQQLHEGKKSVLKVYCASGGGR